MIKRHTPLFLALIVLTGCAAHNRPVQPEPTINITQQEFASNVVFPAFQLLIALGAYYAENGKAPNQGELTTYTSKRQPPIDWQRFSGLEISEAGEEMLVQVNINLANQAEHTSWKFFLKKPSQPSQSVQFAVLPQSHLCVQGRRAADEVMVNLFLDFALSYLTKTAVSTASATSPEFCLHPATGRENQMSERMQKKIEFMQKKMQDKQRSKEESK